MIHVLTKVVLLVLLFFIAACIGLKLLRLLHCNRKSQLETFVLAVACGFAIISEGLLLLGIIGLLTPVSICLLSFGLFLASAREARFLIGSFSHFLRSLSPPVPENFVLLSAFAAFVLINVLKALLPPHGPTDVLYYHMTLPKLYLTHGSIGPFSTMLPSFFPSNGELLFSLSLLLGGPVLVNLTHFGFAILTAMALYAYGQRYFGKCFALLPGIIYLTAPVVNSWGTMAYTANILGFYLFLLVMLLVEEDDSAAWRKTIIWAVLTGMALGLKYQAIPLVGMIYLFFLFLRAKSLGRVFPALVLSLVMGCIFASPWFVRNLVATSNPFFPILNDIFPSTMSQAGSMWGRDTAGSELPPIALARLMENPLSPVAYLLYGAWRYDDFQRFIGPLFLGFAPFVFLLRRNPVKWPLITLVFLVSGLSALLLRENIRYAILLICLLSFLCGGVGQEIFALAKRAERLFLSLFFSTVLILYAVHNYELMLSHKRCLAALNPHLATPFLRTFEPSYRAAEFANRHIPADSKVLFHGLLRYFYFNFEPVNDHLNQRWIVYEDAQNADEILHILRERGITHIICLDEIPKGRRRTHVLYDEDPRFVEFSNRYLERIHSSNGISVYKIVS